MCTVSIRTKRKSLHGCQTNLSIFGSYPKLWPMVSQRSKLQSSWLFWLRLGRRLCGEEVNFWRVPILGRSLVSWSSKKQNCVSLSSTEAEYVAAASCCAQLLWMRQTLKDYGVTCDKVPLLCDNQSAIKISLNPVQHSKTKHIDIRHHFIREHIKLGDIEVHFIHTEEQLADIFTNP